MNKTSKQEKKPTAAQLERRMRNAVVFVPTDKETKEVYFNDKGLRLTVTEDTVVISTAFHCHVFNHITSGGMSRPYLYTARFVEIALDNDCIVRDKLGNPIGRSYARLMEVLKSKEDKTEFNIAFFIDLWLMNIFAPLYEIDETEAGAFLVYERYMHNIARQDFLLSEHKEDVTNKQMLNEVWKKEMSFVEDVEERVVLKAKTDEERTKEEIEALQEQEAENAISQETNGQDN